MTDLKPEKETKGFDEVKEALSISGLVPSGPDSVENFEDKEKWGQLSEEKKKEERKPI